MLFILCISFIVSVHSFHFPLNRFRRQANGCGPIYLNIDRFLQELGEEILIGCCNEHDLCYDTCGKKQYTCDTTFFDCMFQACQQSSDIFRCKDTAKILFWLVFFGGQSSYQQAQQQNHC